MIRPWKVFVFLGLCYLIAGTIDHAAAQVSHLMRLENSALPAGASECARAALGRGRPDWTVSHQHRSREPWLRRTCAWNE